MNINMQKDDSRLTVVLEGRLDTLTSPELEEQLENSLDGIKELIFDFSDLRYVSSAGLRVLIAAQKIMEEQGKMIIRNVCPTVMEVFDITGFIDVFTIE